MMSFLRNGIVLAATTMAAAMVLVPASAQAACNGGACPITGGSLRTVIGGGFIIPQLTPLAGLPNVSSIPGLSFLDTVIAPTGQQLGFGHTANGFVIPKAGVDATIGGTAPFSIMMQPGLLTYGDAPATVLSRQNCVICEPWGQYATPKLVQVPLFLFAPTFLGLSTNIGQSFPGIEVGYPTGLPTMDAPTSITGPRTTQRIGGPVTLKKNGRLGAQNLTFCAGAEVPDPVTDLWEGGCIGFTPTTTNGGLGAQVTPALVKYVGTVNQFGGAATQRQVRREGTKTNPNLGGAPTNKWLGIIRFNRAPPASYTISEWLVPNPTWTSLATPDIPQEIPGTPPTPKTYATQQQGLIEVAAWGADFGVKVQRKGADPGDLVQGIVKTDGGPLNTSTQVIKTTMCCTSNGPGGFSATGTGKGVAATSTTWGAPMTTGQIVVQRISGMATQAFSTFTNTGNDQRTVGGQGMVNLVSGQISIRTSQGTSESGFERSMLTIQLPEPSMALGLMAGVTALVGVSRRRIR
jgi:hypothetical protein